MSVFIYYYILYCNYLSFFCNQPMAFILTISFSNCLPVIQPQTIMHYFLSSKPSNKDHILWVTDYTDYYLQQLLT